MLDDLELRDSQTHGSLLSLCRRLMYRAPSSSSLVHLGNFYYLFKCRSTYIRWYLIRGDSKLVFGCLLKITGCKFVLAFPPSVFTSSITTFDHLNVWLFKKAQHYGQIPKELQYPVCTAANSVSIIMPDKPSWPTTSSSNTSIITQALHSFLMLHQLEPYSHGDSFVHILCLFELLIF